MPRMPTQIALSRKSADPTRAAARAAARAERAPSFGDDSKETAVLAAHAALDKKAEELVILDLRGVSGYTDFLVICSGTSDRQLETVADGVEQALRERGQRSIGSEGQRGGKWVLMDFGDVVVHVFHKDERAHYDLEGLWADAPREKLS